MRPGDSGLKPGNAGNAKLNKHGRFAGCFRKVIREIWWLFCVDCGAICRARGAKSGHESGVLREKWSSCIVGLTSCIIHENGLYCFADPEKK